MTSVAQRRETKINMAKQFCCSGFFMMGMKTRAKKTAMMLTRAKKVPLCRAAPVLAVAAGSLAGMFANFATASRVVFRAR